MIADQGSGAVEVSPVRGKKELTTFIKLPFRLHEGTPWVPPLIMERREFLDRGKNPFFGRADVELLVAWRGGEPVGRISVQIDPRWDEHQGGEDAQFGFIEAEDDPEVFSALFAAAETWARDRGRKRLVGPMDVTTNDECGLLIEGYDQHPLILQPWHPHYYRRRIEELGYGKAMDLLMWNLEMGELKQGDRFADAIHMVADKVESEHGITVRNIDKRDLEAEIGRFMEVYNAAWDANWGFVPVDDDEVAFQAKNLKQVINEDWCFIAERDGETLGAAFTMPDINQVTKRMNGRLLPFGWLKFLLGKGRIDRVRVFALGVKPEYQHTGIAARFYVRHIETAAEVGVSGGDTGWILEVNEPMNRAMEGMGGTVVKKYRLFEKNL
jgi:GNAT superfamily N-acetyltransferase